MYRHVAPADPCLAPIHKPHKPHKSPDPYTTAPRHSDENDDGCERCECCECWPYVHDGQPPKQQNYHGRAEPGTCAILVHEFVRCVGLPFANCSCEWQCLSCKYQRSWWDDVNRYGWSIYVAYSTYALTAVQILLFYAVDDQATRFGVTIPLVPGKETGLLSYVLAHVDEAHLWGNMLTQLIAGVLTEGFEGTLRFQIVYWTSGLAGALIQVLVFDPTPQRPSVTLLGASGAIYGIIFLGLSITIINCEAVWWPWLVIVLYLAALISQLALAFDETLSLQVATGAHLAGALYGVLVGLTIGKNLRVERWETWTRRVLYVVTPLLLVVLAAAAFWRPVGGVV